MLDKIPTCLRGVPLKARWGGYECHRVRRASRPLHKFQRCGIHAIPQAGGRRAVVKNMAEVSVAQRAVHGLANHTKARIAFLANVFLRDRSPETRPPGARLKLRIRTEQCIVATDAAVEAVLVKIPVLARERPLGVRVPGDIECQRRKHLLPVLLALHDLGETYFLEALAIIGELNDGHVSRGASRGRRCSTDDWGAQRPKQAACYSTGGQSQKRPALFKFGRVLLIIGFKHDASPLLSLVSPRSSAAAESGITSRPQGSETPDTPAERPFSNCPP